jgi:hypothetical protein
MTIKTYSKDDLISKKVFGISLLIFGICYLFSKTVSSISIGITSIYIGILITLIRGIEINPEENKLREFISFFGIKLGGWKNFKKPEYISVFKAKYYDGDGSKNEILNINLFFEKNEHLTVYQTGDMEEAFKIADFFKEVLNVNILDATSSESKWL